MLWELWYFLLKLDSNAVIGFLGILVAGNICICVRRKESWINSTILATSLVSAPLIFFFIRIRGPFPGGADIGAGLLIAILSIFNIPLCLLGLYLGRKLRFSVAVTVSLLIVTTYVGFSCLYMWRVRLYDQSLQEKSIVDCQKMPYHCAIQNRDLNQIKILKTQGFDIESKDGWGYSALMRNLRNKEAATVLLENGADANAYDINGDTPLSNVLFHGMAPDFEAAELLVKYGANIDKKYGDKKQMSILISAITEQKSDIIDFAIRNGANSNTDYFGNGTDTCWYVKFYNVKDIGLLEKYCGHQ